MQTGQALVTHEPASRVQPARLYWSRYQWGILIVICFGNIINYIDRVNLSVIMPTLIKTYGLKPATAGVLLSAFNWAMVVGMFCVGPLVDRFHPRRVFPAGVTIWSLATIAAALSPSPAVLSGCRAFLGLGESTLIPSASRLVSELFKKHDQGKATASYFAANKMGLAIGAPLAAAILVHWGWRAVFYVTGALGCVWLLLWFLIYRPNKEVIAEETPERAAGAEPKVKWLSLLTYRETWALMIGDAAYLYVYFVFISWIPSYLVIDRHMSILKSGVYSTFPFLIAFSTAIFSGWLGDRWLKAGGNLTTVRKSLIGFGFTLSTLFMFVGLNVQSQGWAVFCLFWSMGSLGFATPMVNVLPIDLAPRRFVASVAGLQNCGANIGGALAPIVTGVLLGMTGNFRAALYATGAIALIGTVVHTFMLGKIEPRIGLGKERAA